MIQEKNHSIWNFAMPYYVHRQWVMFDTPSHKVVHNNHNKHISNPLNNNETQVKFD